MECAWAHDEDGELRRRTHDFSNLRLFAQTARNPASTRQLAPSSRRTMKTESKLPVAVIGAGPVGLAAAAHLLERGETPLVLEAGDSAGASVRQWSHVRMFSPWHYTVDAASRRLLTRGGWIEPDPRGLPTGGDLVTQYLEPLASRTLLRDYIHFDQRVISITRQNTDKVKTRNREALPFVVRTVSTDGTQRNHLARAVIDASGTWTKPNPMGADGLQPLGEEMVRDRIDYGIPNVNGTRRSDFAGTTVAVVGSGHSAFNAVLDLLALKQDVPDTRIVWFMRRATLEKVFGGGTADALPARGELGQRAREAIESGALTVVAPFAIRRLALVDGNRVQMSGERDGREETFVVDRVIVATGFRPDLDLLREVRVELDPWLESTHALGPLIDPNLHSCGTVRPHGARELAHPENGFYVVGMKSYGRAPTFLLATGYEQVRSVVAELVGDHEAAARVELDLPETGVCSLPASGVAGEEVDGGCCGVEPKKLTVVEATDTGCGCGAEKPAEPALVVAAAATEAGCCGGAPEHNASACCKLDEEKKASGEAGCGCGSKSPETVQSVATKSACC